MDTAPHVRYALHLLSSPMPMSAIGLDAMRVTVVYFALHTLDLCRALPALPPARAAAIAAWLRACLSSPLTAQQLHSDGCGFAGGPCLPPPAPGHAHVACTYAAVCSLRILGAARELQQLPRARLCASLLALQQARTGGMASSPASPAEVDVRFLYSAAALCQLLGLRVAWEEGGAEGGSEEAGGGGSGGDSGCGGGSGCGCALRGPAALRYLAGCQTHEGGFALAAGGGEAHGAATYCALAAWVLLRADAQRAGVALGVGAPRLDVQALRRWLALRAGAEGGGVSGRAGKGGDACYTWWVGASLRMLRDMPLEEGGGGDGGGAAAAAAAAAAGAPLLQAPLGAWLEQCRGTGGAGYGKDTEAEADPFHTVFALAGLALGLEEQAGGEGAALAPVVAALGLSRRALGE